MLPGTAKSKFTPTEMNVAQTCTTVSCTSRRIQCDMTNDAGSESSVARYSVWSVWGQRSHVIWVARDLGLTKDPSKTVK